jgi:hypothetical protein
VRSSPLDLRSALDDGCVFPSGAAAAERASASRERFGQAARGREPPRRTSARRGGTMTGDGAPMAGWIVREIAAEVSANDPHV